MSINKQFNGLELDHVCVLTNEIVLLTLKSGFNILELDHGAG
jgi:hypothetical protein